ncbi:MAG: oxygen-independent coproporphyrinogen III oxidase [Fibrobacterales bacterium]
MKIESTFLDKYNVAGPRYTSYPPAPYFQEEGNIDLFKEVIEQSNDHSKNISFYAHIPFCPTLCYYCGCTTEITTKQDRISTYFEMMRKERENLFPLIDSSRPVTQIHFGGGTPNAVSTDYLKEIVDSIGSRYSFADNAEIAIEVNPNHTSFEQLKTLREIGFNRISIGLQDFKKDVLDYVNRGFPDIPPKELIAYCRDLGFTGINLDLIYGLPGQTVESFQDTIAQTVDADPDRIAAFSYAHVPWVKKSQKVLEKMGLPSPENKIAMAVDTHNLFLDAGYDCIGMDHFAKPTDLLSISKQSKTLHRNFQGYCSQQTTGQVYGLGASSIGQLDSAYIQNQRSGETFGKAITETGFSFNKLYQLSPENQLYRNIINQIMCNGSFSKSILGSFDMTTSQLEQIEIAIAACDTYADDQLLIKTEDGFELTELGMLVPRVIAMKFDPLLTESSEGKYSKTI